jgi:hypothetical protein
VVKFMGKGAIFSKSETSTLVDNFITFICTTRKGKGVFVIVHLFQCNVLIEIQDSHNAEAEDSQRQCARGFFHFF